VLYLEMADAGTLFTRVIETGSLTEDEARPFMAQLASAVSYLHSEGIVHCDIKLENILLKDEQIKLCDFGLAHAFARPPWGGKPLATPLTKVCGSKSYCAPEVLSGSPYDGYGADMWSCGVCCFAMHAGFFPLEEASTSDWRFGRLRHADTSGLSPTMIIFGFYERECSFSPTMIDLIDGLLALEPSRRLTAEQMRSHELLVDIALPPEREDEPMGSDGLQRTVSMPPSSQQHTTPRVAAPTPRFADHQDRVGFSLSGLCDRAAPDARSRHRSNPCHWHNINATTTPLPPAPAVQAVSQFPALLVTSHPRANRRVVTSASESTLIPIQPLAFHGSMLRQPHATKAAAPWTPHRHVAASPSAGRLTSPAVRLTKPPPPHAQSAPVPTARTWGTFHLQRAPGRPSGLAGPLSASIRCS